MEGGLSSFIYVDICHHQEVARFYFQIIMVFLGQWEIQTHMHKDLLLKGDLHQWYSTFSLHVPPDVIFFFSILYPQSCFSPGLLWLTVNLARLVQFYHVIICTFFFFFFQFYVPRKMFSHIPGDMRTSGSRSLIYAKYVTVVRRVEGL
jgi:hypothetical protein